MSLTDLFKNLFKTSDDIIKEIEEDTVDLKPLRKARLLEKKVKETYDKDGNLIIQSKIND